MKVQNTENQKMNVVEPSIAKAKAFETETQKLVSQEGVKQSVKVKDVEPVKMVSATTFHTKTIEKEVPIATYEEAGKVKPDGLTISITDDGTITAFNSRKTNGHTVEKDVPQDAKFTDTTYKNEPAIRGGQDVSLVTTGNKFAWDNKLSQGDRLTNSDIDDIIK